AAMMRVFMCSRTFWAAAPDARKGGTGELHPLYGQRSQAASTIACYHDGVKITRILAYRVELPLHETSYKWSGGKSVTVFDRTILRVETDTGIIGHGQVCPLGPFY